MERKFLNQKKKCTCIIASLIVLSFVLGTCEFIIIGILPEISEYFSVSLTKAGMLVSFFAIAYAIGTPIASLFGSYCSRYRFTIFLMGLFVLGNFLSGLPAGYFSFVLLRIFLAVVPGALLCLSMTFVPDITTRENKAAVIAWIFAGFSVASVFGVLLGTVLTQLFSWHIAFLLIAAISMVLFFLMVWLLPRENEIKKISVLKQLNIFQDKRILFGMGTIIFGAAGNYCWYTYFTPILEEEMNVPETWVSVGLLLFGIATIFSNLSGKYLEKAGGMMILWGIFLMQAIFMSALLLLPVWPVWGAVNLLILGLLLYVQNASIQIYFFRISATCHPGTLAIASALNPTSFNIGIALGTLFGSGVVEMFGLHYVGPAGALCAVLAAALCFASMNPERKRLRKISFSTSKA